MYFIRKRREWRSINGTVEERNKTSEPITAVTGCTCNLLISPYLCISRCFATLEADWSVVSHYLHLLGS